MKVERPNHQHLTPAEAEELARLKTMIEEAVANGVVSHQEAEDIRSAVLRSKPGYELLSQELALYRELVTEKVNAGLLKAEYFSD